MMNKLWALISGILGAFSVFFYVSNKQKDKKIERHKDEAERYKAEAEQQRYIAKSERTTKRIKDQDSGYSDALKRIALMLDSLLVKANSLFF